MELVIFRWRDSALHGQHTRWEDDLGEVSLVTLITAGLLVKEDNESISLCMDWNPEGSWRTLQTYPKSGIKQIRRIKIPASIYKGGANP